MITNRTIVRTKHTLTYADGTTVPRGSVMYVARVFTVHRGEQRVALADGDGRIVLPCVPLRHLVVDTCIPGQFAEPA